MLCYLGADGLLALLNINLHLYSTPAPEASNSPCVQHARDGWCCSSVCSQCFVPVGCSTEGRKASGLPCPSCTHVMAGEEVAFLGAQKCSVGMLLGAGTSRQALGLSQC